MLTAETESALRENHHVPKCAGMTPETGVCEVASPRRIGT